MTRVRVWESDLVPSFCLTFRHFFLSSRCSRSWNSSPIFTFTSSIIEHNEHSLINTSTIQPPLLSSKSRWRFFNQNIDKFVWNKWPESLSPARIFSSPLINTSLKSVYYMVWGSVPSIKLILPDRDNLNTTNRSSFTILNKFTVSNIHKHINRDCFLPCRGILEEKIYIWHLLNLVTISSGKIVWNHIIITFDKMCHTIYFVLACHNGTMWG